MGSELCRRWPTTRRAGIPCYGCGKMATCTIAPDGSACKCWRDGGRIHRRDGMRRPDSVPARPPEPVVVPALTAEWVGRLCAKYQGRVKESDLIEASRQLGVTPASLRQMGIGWDGSAWTFPMFDGSGQAIGLHRRLPDGRKLCLRGSRLGLFSPGDNSGGSGGGDSGDGDRSPQEAGNGACVTTDLVERPLVSPRAPEARRTLLVCEGASDTAAALTLGYDAVGVPSAGQGGEFVLQHVLRSGPPRVVIVADLDEGSCGVRGEVTWPGIEGGLALAARLMPRHRDLHFCLPPPGIKDLRQWLGVSEPDVICAAVDAAPQVHPVWLNRAWQNVRDNRRLRSHGSWSRRAAALLAGVADGELRADLREGFEERAGILEYEADLPRDEAERLAFEDLARKAVRP